MYGDASTHVGDFSDRTTNANLDVVPGVNTAAEDSVSVVYQKRREEKKKNSDNKSYNPNRNSEIINSFDVHAVVPGRS
jgi:hypothetical protein